MGKYSLINIEGETLLKPIYHKVDTIGLNIFLTQQAGNYGLVILDQNWKEKEKMGKPLKKNSLSPNRI